MIDNNLNSIEQPDINPYITEEEYLLLYPTGGLKVPYGNSEMATYASLIRVCGRNQVDIFQKMLDRGLPLDKLYGATDLYATDKSKHRTIAMIAVCYQNPHILNMIIDKVDLNSTENTTSLLSTAAIYESIGIFSTLLEHGALATIPDKTGSNCLHYSCDNEERLHYLEELARHNQLTSEVIHARGWGKPERSAFQGYFIQECRLDNNFESTEYLLQHFNNLYDITLFEADLVDIKLNLNEYRLGTSHLSNVDNYLQKITQMRIVLQEQDLLNRETGVSIGVKHKSESTPSFKI